MTDTVSTPLGTESVIANELTRLPEMLAEACGLKRHLATWGPGQELWFGGVRNSVRALAAVSLIGAANIKSMLMILPEAAEADIVASDLAAFGIQGAMLLPISSGTNDPAGLRDHDLGRRLAILQRLRRRGEEETSGFRPADAESHDAELGVVEERAGGITIVCASVAAAIQAVPSRQAIEGATRRIEVGRTIDVAALLRWLAESGFHQATAVQMPGEFCQRGGILDIYPVDHPAPIRIELFDDEIESVRYFDPASQRSTEKLISFELSSVGPGTADDGTLSEYLTSETAVLIVQPDQCAQAAEKIRNRVADPQRFKAWHDFVRDLATQPMAMAVDLPLGDAANLVKLPTASIEGFSGELDQIRQRIDSVAQGHQVLVVADTPADAQRMGELLRETHAATHGLLKIVVADLSEGFRLTETVVEQSRNGIVSARGVLVLTGAELFHRSPVRRVRSHVKSKPLDNLLQLEPGDLVVHLSYGIGLYRGVQTMEKGGQPQEHLVIEFDGQAKIYVPAHRIGLIQRYVGGGSSRPRLAKVSGQAWGKQRKAVEHAVEDMAGELLEVQAKRRARSGLAFDQDSEWQHQFDASFPYTETTDQLSAIEACKGDMERPQPMDRLICGDVGFGKTEVAMRAAFKAVDSGYQVAILVPTTILAEQHYHTFLQRMAEFPVDIGRLNRFADPSEEKETIARLKKGQIDIVIGTHRLAGKSVEFFNLGLVIIDEEHRFGVGIKERLKAKHSQVDVLTLSATPIPRTLHMALVGVRDISNLETPPAERLSVETQILRWDEKVIRQAIVREMNRGGQVYFVHNRIADIHKLAERIQRIVPEAQIGVGHGRMDEHDLEQVMIDFIQRKFDILLATTIVENGLDIPNANTIFVDEADRYGLADLHQLRGRVGRYKHQAYCYMLVDSNKYLTPEASKRLRAIEEFSQMGAGFAISMRDLEIRGAGNLLGTQQSGHIAAVGYELYCQLLEDAVRRAQNLPPRITAEVDIDLPVAAYLPPDYVPDMRHKIDLYRRIAKLDSYDAIDEMRAEMIDRFGPLPGVVARLLELSTLRLDAAIWQIFAVSYDREFMVLRYGDAQRIAQLKRKSPVPVRIVDAHRAYIPVDTNEFEDPSDGWLNLLASILRIL